MAHRAVILAGGLGTRLRPYTHVIPKPLMPVGNLPILEVILRQLGHHGFLRATISTGYLAHLVRATIGLGDYLGMLIDYVHEEEPLGTAGALALVDHAPDDHLLVMNGDVLTDLDFRAFLDAHVASGAALSVATHQREVQVSLGVLRFDDAEDRTRVTGYDEKPRLDYEASMGVYAFSPTALRRVAEPRHLDFPDLVLELLADGERVNAFRNDAFWLDIGTPEDYERAQEDFAASRERFLPGG